MAGFSETRDSWGYLFALNVLASCLSLRGHPAEMKVLVKEEDSQKFPPCFLALWTV